jgi:hypothetical protein
MMMEKTVGTIKISPKKTNLNTPKLSNCLRISIAILSEGKKGKFKFKKKKKTHQISIFLVFSLVANFFFAKHKDD